MCGLRGLGGLSLACRWLPVGACLLLSGLHADLRQFGRELSAAAQVLFLGHSREHKDHVRLLVFLCRFWVLLVILVILAGSPYGRGASHIPVLQNSGHHPEAPRPAISVTRGLLAPADHLRQKRREQHVFRGDLVGQLGAQIVRHCAKLYAIPVLQRPLHRFFDVVREHRDAERVRQRRRKKPHHVPELTHVPSAEDAVYCLLQRVCPGLLRQEVYVQDPHLAEAGEQPKRVLLEQRVAVAAPQV
mmetsp:Transcript_2957/g.7875  ORF Transcript_2957/g.7875 Transcript_2957/m.7875 type:complete len:245 (-) Transcript_2957:428-1162(-)